MTADYTDEDTLRALKASEGDTGSFNELLERYTNLLVNFAYRFTGNRSDAEEIAQETFLRVYRSLPGYKPSARFSTWLYRIAVNLCYDYRRKKRGDPLSHAESILPDDGEREEAPRQYADTSEKLIETRLEQADTDRLVRAALAALPPNQRLALSLKEFEDKSYAEIAEILSVSVPTVESLLFRARQNLKKTLSPAE